MLSRLFSNNTKKQKSPTYDPTLFGPEFRSPVTTDDTTFTRKNASPKSQTSTRKRSYGNRVRGLFTSKKKYDSAVDAGLSKTRPLSRSQKIVILKETINNTNRSMIELESKIAAETVKMNKEFKSGNKTRALYHFKLIKIYQKQLQHFSEHKPEWENNLKTIEQEGGKIKRRKMFSRKQSRGFKTGGGFFSRTNSNGTQKRGFFSRMFSRNKTPNIRTTSNTLTPEDIAAFAELEALYESFTPEELEELDNTLTPEEAAEIATEKREMAILEQEMEDLRKTINEILATNRGAASGVYDIDSSDDNDDNDDSELLAELAELEELEELEKLAELEKLKKSGGTRKKHKHKKHKKHKKKH